MPNYIAQDNLGGALRPRTDWKKPLDTIARAAEIHPVDPISAFNIGFYEQQHGDLEQAIEQYRQAIILTTSPSLKIKALTNMG